MKKIILYLCIVALCVAMFCGSFVMAAEMDTSMKYKGRENIDLDATPTVEVFGVRGYTTTENKFFEQVQVRTLDDGSLWIGLKASTYWAGFYQNGSWSFDGYVHFTDLYWDTATDRKKEVFTAIFDVRHCDGSSCPATDVNDDMICDDCGMMLYRLGGVPNGGYPSTLPAPPAEYESYTILTENGNTWLYMVNGEVPQLSISEASDDGKRTLYFTMEGSYPQISIQRYRLSDGEWVYNSVNSLRSFSFDESLNFVYSTVDIYDTSGQLFFPLPLWEMMGQVTQGEMNQTTETVVGTMKTLVLCGVGCLALLVVLSLFGKRSLISRN